MPLSRLVKHVLKGLSEGKTVSTKVGTTFHIQGELSLASKPASLLNSECVCLRGAATDPGTQLPQHLHLWIWEQQFYKTPQGF